MKRTSGRLLFFAQCIIIVLGLAGTAMAHPGHRHGYGHNAPEIDPSLMSSGLAVLMGGALLLLERHRRR